MFKMRKSYIEAAQKAEELLKKRKIAAPIVDTDEIIKLVQKETGYDIKVFKTDFSRQKAEIAQKFGGLMSVVKKKKNGAQGEVIIFLNNKYDPQMMRFSAMHEIGHLVTMDLDKLEEGKVYASAHICADINYISEEEVQKNEYLESEQVANIFALSVLMPKDEFNEAIDQLSIKRVAALFGVTPDAVCSRFKMLMAE